MAAPADTLSLAGRLGRLLLLFLAHAVGTANITVVMAAAPAIERSLGLNHAAFGLVVAAYYAAILACSIPAGYLADRFGIRLALVMAGAATGLGMLVFAHAQGSGPAMLGLMLCGTGYSLINPATARGVLAWFPQRGRGTAMGAKQTGVPAGGLAAAVAAAALADWRHLALAVALLTLAAAAGCACLRLEEPRVGARARAGDIREVLRLPPVVVFNFAAALYAAAQGATLAYLVLYAREVLGAGAGLASLCLGIVHVASAAGRVGWGVVSDAMTRNGRLFGLLACGVAAALGIVSLVLAPWLGGLAALPVVAGLLGLTVAGYAGLSQIAAAEAVEPKLAGAAIGYNMLLTNGGMMLGPLVFGAGVEFVGYGPSWLCLAAAVLVGAGLFHLSFATARAAHEGARKPRA